MPFPPRSACSLPTRSHCSLPARPDGSLPRRPLAPVLAGLLLWGLALAGTSPRVAADVLELVDGRLVEGTVVEEEDRFLVFSRFGESVVAADQVREHIRQKPIDEQVREHLASLDPDDAAGRALLARWLRDVGREEEATALAEAVLDLDPENALAHEVLGHVRHGGAWMSPDEAKRAQGLEKHGDRWYTPREWQNLEGAERRAAEDEEARRQEREAGEAINRSVRLMMSPDPALRSRGRSHLLGLAEERDDDRLRRLVPQVEAYRDALDAHAAALRGGGAHGSVLSEIRATMTRLKRPIKVFETGLASSAGSGTVKIQLPELEVVRVRTTVAIPAIID